MNKHITHPSQVKAGLYIRAYVNCHGNCAFSTVKVVGRPFMADWCQDEKLLAFKVDHHYDKRYYASDLGATGRSESTRLYPFSNKLWSKLTQLQGGWDYNKHNRPFTEFIYGRQLTNQQWEDQVLDWNMMIEMDQRMDELMSYDWDEYDRDVHESALRYED